MKSKEFVEFAQKMFEAGLPFIVEGQPGMAKTALIELAAQLAGMECIVTHPAVRSPIDYGGIPAQVRPADGKKSAEWDFVPIGDLRRLVSAKKPTVFFMDDFGQGSTATQNATCHLIHARQIGENKISDEVRICAATNRAQDKSGVSPILEHVKSRFATIVHLDPDVDAWLDWASTVDDIGLLNVQETMPPALIAFIAWKRTLLYGFEPKPGLENTPTPRTVHHVGQILAAGAVTERTAFEIITGAAGRGFATELMAFLKVHAHLPDPEDVLKNPDIIDSMMFEQYGWSEEKNGVVSLGTTSVSRRPDVAFALVTSASDIVEPGQMLNYVKLIRKFDKPVEVLGMLLVKNRGDQFLETRSFISWARDNQAYML
jgi:hypothetical protein